MRTEPDQERPEQGAIWEMERHVARAIDVARRAGIDRSRVISAVNEYFGIVETKDSKSDSTAR